MIENPKHDLVEVPPATLPNLVAEKQQPLAQMIEGVAPGIMRGRAAFLRDLPELLKNPKDDRWCVAYTGDARIALAETKKEVIREVLKRGLGEKDYFLGLVVPYDDDEDWEIEPSFSEFDDIE